MDGLFPFDAKPCATPPEQLMLALTFPAANKTINFIVDSLRRTTMVKPSTRDALGVGGVTCEDWSNSFGECVELPAARIGNERGDHFLLVTDAIVANKEQARGGGRVCERLQHRRLVFWCFGVLVFWCFGW